MEQGSDSHLLCTKELELRAGNGLELVQGSPHPDPNTLQPAYSLSLLERSWAGCVIDHDLYPLLQLLLEFLP